MPKSDIRHFQDLASHRISNSRCSKISMSRDKCQQISARWADPAKTVHRYGGVLVVFMNGVLSLAGISQAGDGPHTVAPKFLSPFARDNNTPEINLYLYRKLTTCCTLLLSHKISSLLFLCWQTEKGPHDDLILVPSASFGILHVCMRAPRRLAPPYCGRLRI